MNQKIVLCIDDEETVLESLEMELSGHSGYTIELATSGEDAFELVEEHLNEGNEIAVVISDYIMPQMKGDAVLIKIHEKLPSTVNILLTGQAQMEGVTKAINDAALYRYIAKPWDKNDLKLTLNEAIHKYEADKKIAEQEQLIHDLNDTLKDLPKAETTENENKLYENELYDQLFFIRYYRSLSSEIKEWISRAAIGLMCADYKISKPELIFLEGILKNDPEVERVKRYMSWIKGMVQPDLTILKVDQQTTFDILNNLAWILIAQNKVNQKEERYFEFICGKLGQDASVSNDFMTMAKIRIRSNYMKHILKKQISQIKPLYRRDTNTSSKQKVQKVVDVNPLLSNK